MTPSDFYTKHDWKLFREKLPLWQEAYMDRLNRAYIALLSKKGPSPSEKFWALDKRLEQDKQSVGVEAALRPSDMPRQLAELLAGRAIREEDLEEFSPQLKSRVHILADLMR